MPKSCAVYQCSATVATNKDRSFHQIPKDPKLREAWVKKIRREDFVPSASSYVCSFHFGEEDFSKGNPNTPLEFQKKSLKKLAIPMWNLRGTEGDQRISSRTSFTSQRTRSSEQASEGEELLSMEQNADEVDPPTTTEKDPFQEVEELQMKLTGARAEIERLKPRLFNFSTLTNDEIRNYTSLESSKFLAVVEMIESFQPLTYWSGKTVNSLSSSDQLLIFLMKMKLDLPYFDLAKRFSVSQTTIQNIFLTYLNVLHELIFIGCLDQLPSIAKNRCSMPESFKDISNCRIIIDCTEFQN